MDPQLSDRLKAIEEHLNHIDTKVSKIRSVQRTSMAMKGVYWVFIILLGLGAFYYVQPYVDQVKSVYTGAQDDMDNLNQLINQFKGTDR
jgi:hypothetical protein